MVTPGGESSGYMPWLILITITVCPVDELTLVPALLFNTLPALQLLGIRTLLPKALERLLRPRLSMKISSQEKNLNVGHLSTGDVLSFDWRVALGEHQLTRTEFEKLLQGAAGVVRFRDEYVWLDPAEVARLQARLEHPPQLSVSLTVRK